MTGCQCDDLYELFDDLCDGSISAGDVAQLDGLLLSDAAARWQYLCYLDVHAGLGLVGSGGQGPGPDTMVPRGGLSAVGRGQGSEFRVQGANSARDSSSLSPPLFVIHPSPTIQYPLFATQFAVGGMLFSYSVAALIFSIGLLIGAVVHVSEPVPIARQSAPLPSPLSPVPAWSARLPAWSVASGKGVQGSGFRVQVLKIRNQESEIRNAASPSATSWPSPPA